MMAKLGINISINVNKIDKSRLFKGDKGNYLDLTTFIDTEKTDQYDNHGFISQSTTKEERENKIQTPILGNCKVFYQDGSTTQTTAPVSNPGDDVFTEDDIPF